QPATGSHTTSGTPGAIPNGSSTATGRSPLQRSSSVSSRSSSFVSVTNAAPGAANSAGVSRSSVFPDPCGPYTPAARSTATPPPAPAGAWPRPTPQPTPWGRTRFTTPPPGPPRTSHGGGPFAGGAVSTAPPPPPPRYGWPCPAAPEAPAAATTTPPAT